MGQRWVPIAAVIALAGTAHADDLDSGASSAHKPGFVSEGNLTGDWGGRRTELFDHGVSILGSYALEVFTTPALDDDRAASPASGRSRSIWI